MREDLPSNLVAGAIYQDRVALHEALCMSHAGDVSDLLDER